MARIKGSNSNDVLFGTDRDDAIKALAGDDTIHSSDGYDYIDGGRGSDTVDYSSYTGSLSIVLHENREARVWGNGIVSDTLVSVENLIGGECDDYFAGDSADNTFWGNGGHDYFVSSCGYDTYYGGSGYDMVDFSGVGTGILVKASRHGSTVSTDGTVYDHLYSIENLIGTRFDDTILGDKLNNYYRGGDGNDKITGAAGGDVLDGGNGNDCLTGGKDADIFVFGKDFGNDVVTDFNAKGQSHDVLDFTAYELCDSCKTLFDRHVSQHGNDVLIDSLDGDTVILKNVDINDLDKSDFLL